MGGPIWCTCTRNSKGAGKGKRGSMMVLVLTYEDHLFLGEEGCEISTGTLGGGEEGQESKNNMGRGRVRVPSCSLECVVFS